MKLFEIEERVNDDKDFYTGIRLSYVNPEYIIDIQDNYNIHNEQQGSKIHVQGAMVSTFYDVRTPEEIAEILKAL